MTDQSCAGRSGIPGNDGRCPVEPKFAVSVPAGPGKVSVSYACGLHLSWLVTYRTVPGRAVTVERLR